MWRTTTAASSAGLNVVVGSATRRPRTSPLIDAAFRNGIYPVSPLHINSEPDRAGLVMGYASQSPESLPEGVLRVATAMGQGMIELIRP